jgi:hypothetical protein
MTSSRKNKYPIYIPSKGRSEKNPTIEMLSKEGIEFFVVVEPQDFEAYSAKYPSVLCMPENNRGLGYARNFCRNHSVKIGATHHWQFDDNIRSLMVRSSTKNVRSPAAPLLRYIEKVMDDHENIGACGLKYHIFAFAARNTIDLNKQLSSGILVKNSIPCFWNDSIVEDTDFSLQILFAGYCTMLFNKILIEKIATGVMKGGCTDSTYKGTGRTDNQLALINKYPGHFELTNQYGRTKIRPSRVWNIFKQKPLKRIL